MNEAPVRRALLSVWDKADLIAFARGLAQRARRAAGGDQLDSSRTREAARERDQWALSYRIRRVGRVLHSSTRDPGGVRLW